MKIEKAIITSIILAIYIIITIGIISALSITDVSTSPSEVEAGKTFDVSIRLKNDADVDLKDVSVSLDLTNAPFAPFDSSSEQSFDEILEDKSKEASFSLITLTESKPGIYKIPINVKYTEDGSDNQKTKAGLISVTINSKPILDIQQSDNVLIKGADEKIIIKLVNKGTADIKFLEVKLGSLSYYSLTSSDTVYIGDLDANDFDTAEFSAFFKTTAPSTIELPISVTYKDIFNKEYTEFFSIPIKVYSQKEAVSLGLVQQSKTLLYVVVVAVLIISYIVYRRIRKRMKMKKAEEGK